MSKHAAGPWETLTFSNHELQTDFAMVKIGGRVHMIGYSEEDKANARLIAAAPDLLAALEAMNTRGEWHGANWAVPAEVWREARAAIAKAKGEA